MIRYSSNTSPLLKHHEPSTCSVLPDKKTIGSTDQSCFNYKPCRVTGTCTVCLVCSGCAAQCRNHCCDASNKQDFYEYAPTIRYSGHATSVNDVCLISLGHGSLTRRLQSNRKFEIQHQPVFEMLWH